MPPDKASSDPGTHTLLPLYEYSEYRDRSTIPAGGRGHALFSATATYSALGDVITATDP